MCMWTTVSLQGTLRGMFENGPDFQIFYRKYLLLYNWKSINSKCRTRKKRERGRKKATVLKDLVRVHCCPLSYLGPPQALCTVGCL
jgi:hypothetical protein